MDVIRQLEAEGKYALANWKKKSIKSAASVDEVSKQILSVCENYTKQINLAKKNMSLGPTLLDISNSAIKDFSRWNKILKSKDMSGK